MLFSPGIWFIISGSQRGKEREKEGSVAEWLGRALQKLLQRFESARNLEEIRRKNHRKVVFLFERQNLLEDLIRVL